MQPYFTLHALALETSNSKVLKNLASILVCFLWL